MISNLMTGIYGTDQSGWLLDTEEVPRVLREGTTPSCDAGHWVHRDIGEAGI